MSNNHNLHGHTLIHLLEKLSPDTLKIVIEEFDNASITNASTRTGKAKFLNDECKGILHLFR
jgi:hypothetical protein